MATTELGVEPASVDFEVRRNEDFRSAELEITDEDDAPRSLVGAVLRLQVRREAGSPNPPLLELTIGSGITILNAAQGRIRIQINRGTLAAGHYAHDLVEEVGSARTVLWSGSMHVIEGPTQW